ncbi:MAG: phosphoserine phosphatase SerB [Methanosphaera sp.]|nr:phosphoserine phosphatase SerB [Methanosphaera sp.]
MIKLVVFDLDNVLIDTETIDEIAKIKGIEEEISDITLQAMQGKIPFEESIIQRVKKLEGISVDEINSVIDNIPLMNGAIEAANGLKSQGYKIAIITGSFDVIALKLKEKLNVDYAFYNTLEVEDGKLNGVVRGPLVTQNKIDVLKGLIEEIGLSLDECAAIGDGANDVEMIKNVKLGIAFNAKPILKENADVEINEKDLRKVLDIMADEENITKEEVVEETTTTQEDEIIENTPETEDVEETEVIEETTESTEETEEEAEKESEEEESEEAEEESEEEEAEEAEEESEEEEAEEESIDYSKLNFQQLLQVKRTLESELTELKDVRDHMNERTKQYRKERDELNQELKDTLQIALDKRNQRDEINKQVHENKELRNECNEQLKKVEWNSGKKEISNIQAEIKKIDQTIQTKVLDIRKENELVKRVSDLTKQLKKIQSDEEEEKTANQLKEKSEQYHQKVVELSDEAQKLHEEMIEYFNNIDEIREKADGKHQDFINSRNEATAKHEEVKAKLSEIRKVNKFMDQAKASSKGRKKEERVETDQQEKHEAEEIFQKFKDGKKLTTEEFLLLQKYNIM